MSFSVSAMLFFCARAGVAMSGEKVLGGALGCDCNASLKRRIEAQEVECVLGAGEIEPFCESERVAAWGWKTGF